MAVVFITVVVAAIIGFGTNLLAIIMLFRPWHEWRFLGMKVPLTPGLIPKRQAEIAEKLGEVVEKHLLTDEGIVSSLNRPEWIEEMRSRILTWMADALAQSPTVGDVLTKMTGKTRDEILQDSEQWVRTYGNGVVSGFQEKQLRDLIPASLQDAITVRVDGLAVVLTEKALDWIESQETRQWLSAAIQERLMGGGVLGRMAGMFVQEDKLVNELLPHLKNWLESPSTVRFVQEKLQQEWQILLDRNAGEILAGWCGTVEIERMAAPILDWDLRAFVENNRQRLETFLEQVLQRIQQSSAAWASPLLRSIGIRRIVEEQVTSFPIPKLEKLVVDVVKKELQLITWLGALLGGLIGLIQALLIMWWQ